ncbi:hypothetical protein FPQ18DRAFT_304425 [Pyronema domesticum]|nr:hypothetical protein FPQ18DRAFT_304425 [Pyronema domesticum]
MAALGSVLCSRSCVFLTVKELSPLNTRYSLSIPRVFASILFRNMDQDKPATDSIQISPPYTGPEMTQLIYDVLLWIDTHWSELGPISSDPPPRNFEGLISTFKDFRKHITSTDVDVDTRAQFTVILDQIERVNLLFNHYWDTTFIISTPLDRIKQYRDDFKQGVLGEMIQGRDLSNPLRPATLKYIDTVLVWIEDNIKEYYPQKTIPTDDDVMYLLFITPCSDGRGITEAMKILMQIVRIKAFVEYYQQQWYPEEANTFIQKIFEKCEETNRIWYTTGLPDCSLDEINALVLAEVRQMLILTHKLLKDEEQYNHEWSETKEPPPEQPEILPINPKLHEEVRLRRERAGQLKLGPDSYEALWAIYRTKPFENSTAVIVNELHDFIYPAFWLQRQADIRRGNGIERKAKKALENEAKETEEEKKSREENRQKAIDKMLAVNKRRPGNAGINEPNYTEPYAKPTDEPPNASVQFTTINW